MDDQRFAAGIDKAPDGNAHLVLVERRAHRARCLDALGNLEPQIARDHRHEDAGHAVGLRPGAAAELDDVAKAARGDHAGHGQPPLQHGVGRRRGAVDDEIDRLDREAGAASADITPCAWLSTVVGVLATRTLPSRPSTRIRSVKVPPISMPATTLPAGCAIFLWHRRNPKCANYGHGVVWKGFPRRNLDPIFVCILINSGDKARLCFQRLATRRARPAREFVHAASPAPCRRRTADRAPQFAIPAGVHAETVVSVKHYTDRLFSFRITRPQSFRFRSGEFVMIGLPNAEKPVFRAFSIASPSWDDEIEFFSIKVPDGPLTSRTAEDRARRHGADAPEVDRHAGARRADAGQAPVHDLDRNRHRARSRAWCATPRPMRSSSRSCSPTPAATMPNWPMARSCSRRLPTIR